MRALCCVLFFNAVTYNFAKIPSSEESLQDAVVNDTRIVGGAEVNITDHPYQVSLEITKHQQTFLCGGFIVSERWILTAAHCVLNVEPSDVVARAGSTWVLDGKIIPLAEIISHPEYNKSMHDKDVAAMKTARPIEFTDSIKPIAIAPIARHMRPWTYVKVSGWGRTEEEDAPDKLMSVEIPVVWYPVCYLSYLSVLTWNMWCGGNFVMGGQGPCEGDSGGTAIQEDMAVGIVSFGRECGQRMSPAVFTDISAISIRHFIANYTGL